MPDSITVGIMKKSTLFEQFTNRIFLIILMGVFVLGCSTKNDKSSAVKENIDELISNKSSRSEIRKVSFLPYWVSPSQFAGYYIALEKGIYKKYNLDVNIIQYRPFITSTDLIASGDADFSALWLANAIQLKASGVDIVNIAQPSSRSSLMLITKKKSGIDSIEKMNGRRAGIWNGYEMQPKALFNKYNVNVEFVPIGSTNTLFLMDAVEITNANWFDEYHSILNSGYNPDELNTFFFADYGMNFLEDGIYCLSKLAKNEPDVCIDFINATLDGWRYAFTHKQETLDIVVKVAKNYNLPVNRVHMEWTLDRYKDLYLPEGKTEFNNILHEKDYQLVGKVLKDDKIINEIPDYNEFYQPLIK